MGWSLPLGRYFGVPVRVHWTFFILITLLGAWVGSKEGWSAAGIWLVTILLVFGSVLLHELGHSVTAILLGYEVRDITLLPIGGVARMETHVRDPLDELLITVAGPLVNYVIALVLAGVLLLGLADFQAVPDVTSPYFVSNLLWLNIILGTFNLLPAFPMDGGRIFRALLALILGRLTATRIASFLGQLMALLLVIVGLFLNPWFLLIGGFVFFAGRAESRAVALDERMRGVKAGSIIIRNPFVLPLSARVSEALELAGSTFQQDFPVVDELGRLVSYVDRGVLHLPATQSKLDQPVANLSVPPLVISEQDDLSEVYSELAARGLGSAVMLDPAGRPIGLLPLEQVRKVMVYGWGRSKSASEEKEMTRGVEAEHSPS